MKKVIRFISCFLIFSSLFSFNISIGKTNSKVISPVSGEIVSGFFTIKIASDKQKSDMNVCMVFQDGTNEIKTMFYENGFYYCNVDSRNYANGSLYFFSLLGSAENQMDDSDIIAIIIDNSETSLLGKIEPSLTRNGTTTVLSLIANIPLMNVWVTLENGIKFELEFDKQNNVWKKNFFVPLTYNEGSHTILFEGIDAGNNSIKTNSSFMVCNSEPFFTFPANGANVLSKNIQLKGIFTPGEKVYLYQKKGNAKIFQNVFLTSTESDSKGEWIIEPVIADQGKKTFSVFAHKNNNPLVTFPYQSVDIDKFNQGLVVLNYHNIIKNGSTYSRTPEQFREDLLFLKTNGFNPITPVLFFSYLEGKGELPEKPVLITFDDGLTGVYLNAYPLLKEFGYSATIFVIVSRIEQNLDYLNWKQLSEMQGSRVFSVESHTFNSHFFVDDEKGRHAALISKLVLPDGSMESQEQYVSRITDDLKKSKDKIEEKLNKKVGFLAIPFGIGDKTVAKISASLGFKGIFNSGGGVNPIPFDRWNIKRITIKATDLLSDYLY